MFKLVIFNYLVGNDDMHLKNFSVITSDGKVRLSPGYDLLNTTIEYNDPVEEIALSMEGKKRNLTRNILIDYYGTERCELTVKSIDRVLEPISTAVPRWRELIGIRYLSGMMHDKYLNLLNLRLSTLEIQ